MSCIPVEFVDYDEFLAIETALASVDSAVASSPAAAENYHRTSGLPKKRKRNSPPCRDAEAQHADLLNDGCKSQLEAGASTQNRIGNSDPGSKIGDFYQETGHSGRGNNATSSNMHFISRMDVGATRRLPSWPRDIANRHRTPSVSESIEMKQPPAVVHCPQISSLPGTSNVVEESSVSQSFPWGLAPSTCGAVTKCKLPYLQFKGRIIYSSTRSDAEEAARELLRLLESKKASSSGSVPLGFDTEWKVIFKRGAPRRKVAVLQLCVNAERCDVFHLIHFGIPPSLQIVLEDPSIIKVGVGAYGDAIKLRMDYKISVTGIKDLNCVANIKLGGPNEDTQPNRPRSLSSLAQELLGKQVDKTGSIRTGDWEVEKLSVPQLQYAATDAFASLFIFQVLMTFPDPVKEDAHSCPRLMT